RARLRPRLRPGRGRGRGARPGADRPRLQGGAHPGRHPGPRAARRLRRRQPAGAPRLPGRGDLGARAVPARDPAPVRAVARLPRRGGRAAPRRPRAPDADRGRRPAGEGARAGAPLLPRGLPAPRAQGELPPHPPTHDDDARHGRAVPLQVGVPAGHRRAADRLLRCDVGHVGGVTEARKIAAIAEPYGVKTAWHGPGDVGPATHAANVHLDLAIPNFGIQETVSFPEAVHEAMPGAPVFRDGYLDVAQAPGLGVDLNEAAAARYPYQRAYLPTSRRLDGSIQDW